MAILSQAALDHVVGLRKPGAPLIHVLDVGANPIEGDAPYKALLEQGLCRVTGFEPQPLALAQLLERKGPHETYLADAVGAGGEAVLHLTRASGFTSLFRADDRVAGLLGWTRQMRRTGTIAVTTRRLDEMAAVGPVDFLKIDVQGSELAIISNAVARLSEAVAVQTEVRFLPIYDGEPRFGDLDRELAAQGFQFHDFVHLKRVNLAGAHAGRLRRRAARQVVDGDAIYLRDLSRAEMLGRDQLLRMAVLALGVFGSAGVAVHCLDILAERGQVVAGAVETLIGLLPPELVQDGAG